MTTLTKPKNSKPSQIANGGSREMRDADLDKQQLELCGELRCSHCERELAVGKVEWLELNCVTGEWAEPGAADWSDGPDSQGMFPLGLGCAKRRPYRQSKRA